MSKKFYVVRKGTVPGIYTTWAECEAQVRGVSGAEYKSFKSEADAQTWLGESSESGLWDPPAPPAPTALPNAPANTESDPDDLPPWDLPPDDTATPADRPPASQPPPESAPPAAPATDYRRQLDEKAAAFLAHLQEQGVPAYAAEGGNEYHERIGIEDNQYLELYHTKRHPFDLRPGKIQDKALLDRVTGLWRAFHWSGASEDGEPTHSPWDTVEHYYALLAPYAALRFDFVALACALRNAAPEAPDPDAVRYDFAQIETAYRQLRPQTA